MAKGLTVKKVKKILGHGAVRGRRLSARQRRLFGARAGGRKVRGR